MCTLKDDVNMAEVEVNGMDSKEKRSLKFNFVNINKTSRAVIISSASAIELGLDDISEAEQTLGSLLTDIEHQASRSDAVRSRAKVTLLSSISGATNSRAMEPMLKRSEIFMVQSDEFHTFWFSMMRQKFQSNFDDQFSKEMLIDFFNKEIVRAVAYTTPSWIKSSMTLASDADVTGEAKVSLSP
jgi:hypothetical protein